MNTENTTVETPVKRGPGRPMKMDATRTLNINPETGKAFGRGRLPSGSKVVVVTCHRQYNSDNFILGVTPVVSSVEKVVPGNKAAAPIHNVNVTVIEPESAAPVEVAPVESGVEIPA